MSNRLATIADRQIKSRLRDMAFAILVVFAGGVAIAGVSTAVHAAQVASR